MTYKIFVWGLVQGVGFRPFVLRLAQEKNITGYVKNKGALVEIIAQGNEQALKIFFQRLACCLPNGAEIWNISKTVIENAEIYNEFYIEQSSNKDDMLPLVMPDIATCDACEKELFDSNNRRFYHPFISCTVCGPRYSVLNKLAYDRCNTVLDKFPLCDDCSEEYNNSDDIRCYAQTICCNNCGPELFYTEKGNPIKNAVNALKNGGVIAVKDIGGFHFACNANDETAVNKLRLLKKREEKPFAVMFENTESIKEYAFVNDMESDLLKSSAAPIVLLKKKKDFGGFVCQNSGDVGAMLPSNPVQHMLIRSVNFPLVMTSANITNEPIITDNETVLKLWNDSVYLDGVLYHNRDILTPLDDSVTRVISGRAQILRRARGYVPLPIVLSKKTDKIILATGGDLKSSFCLVKENFVYLSQYFGDLENEQVFETYKNNISHMENLLSLHHNYLVSDLHPDYFSSGVYNADLSVQHHFAHIASVIAEHNLKGDVLGFAFDGTGYGTDDTVWGGEIVIFKDKKFSRAENLKPVKFFGGNTVSKDARKALNCYLNEIGKCNDDMVKTVLSSNIGCFNSTSMGRLFDAVAALLEIENFNSFEGKCAIALEKEAGKANDFIKFEIPNWDWRVLLNQIIAAKDSGEKISSIALGFHVAIADEILNTAKRYDIKNIALSGGVFANRILTERAISLLEKNGYNAYINEKVPTNDGGICLGQAYMAMLSK